MSRAVGIEKLMRRGEWLRRYRCTEACGCIKSCRSTEVSAS